MEVDEGSVLCLACLDAIIVDNQDAAPLYREVIPCLLERICLCLSMWSGMKLQWTQRQRWSLFSAPRKAIHAACASPIEPWVYMLQVLQFYESQGLRLREEPPLLMVKSAELGNAASREPHQCSDRGAASGQAAAPAFHTRQAAVLAVLQLRFYILYNESKRTRGVCRECVSLIRSAVRIRRPSKQEITKLWSTSEMHEWWRAIML